MEKKSKNRLISLLFVLIFMLSASSLFTSNYNNLDSDTNLSIASDNYLFNGKEYDIELNDVYDDEDLYKIYTGANFSYIFLENESTTFNEVVSPVNNSEFKSPSVDGHFPATYSFESDADGDVPVDWIESGTGKLEVLSNVEGHEKVMNFKFPNNADYGQIDITSQTGELTIEFWVYRPDLIGQCFFRMMGTSGGSEDIYFNNGGGVTYYKADASFPNIFTVVVETWYHIKIELDVDASNNIISVWVDGVLKIDEEETYNDTPDIGHIRLYEGNAGSTLGINWDAFGFSWDPEYTPSEHHAGTYSFTNELGKTNTDISHVASVGTGLSLEVIASESLHKNVLEINFDDAIGGLYSKWYTPYSSEPTSGTIEFWVKMEDVGQQWQQQVRAIDNGCLWQMRVSTTQVRFVCEAGNFDIVVDTTEWVHIRVDFDCGANSMSAWVNELLVVNVQTIYGRSEFRRYNWQNNVDLSAIMWTDAVAYSWDTYYDIGDNLYASMGNLYSEPITMLEGAFDNTDNMKEYDGSYSSFYSTDLPSIHNEMPVQWTDFAYTYGTSGGVAGTGSTQYNDAVNYAYMNAESDTGSETLLGYIVPNGNILQNWNNGDTTSHFALIDEAKADMNGDGGNIRETSVGVSDRWNFNSLTIPANSEITRLYIGFYSRGSAGDGSTFTVTSNCFTSGSIDPDRYGYTWQYIDKTGLSISQAELDALYVNVQTAGTAVYCDIETVYIDVYYKTTTYKHTSIITWDYTGANIDYLDTLYYDYATTVAIDMDLDIWDWVAGSYNYEIESNTGTSYITGSYDLSSNPNKVSGTNQVRVRFETASASSDFDVRLDQLMFDFVLTTDEDPELETIMETTFSNYDSSKILSIEVESYHKTDVAQTIVFSIYNYNTPAWETITSQSQTSFTQNLFQTNSSLNNYFDNDGKMKLRYYGTSSTQEFDLHIDNLNITITYKMDLSHSITFNTNGLWKYRWVLFGSIQYTDWTYFEVIDPDPNFYAISESDLTTRWILQNASLTAVEDFHDDINTNYWNLITDEETIHINYDSYTDSQWEDSYASDVDNPNQNYGTWEFMLFYDEFSRTSFPYIKREIPYLITNYTSDSTLRAYCYATASYYPFDFDVYQTSDFEEMEITWSNRPAGFNYQDTQTVSSEAWYNVNLGEPYNYYMLDLDSTDIVGYMGSSESSSYHPNIYHHISKNYFGSGYMYMQTNITESIGLKSQDYGTHKTLNSGDYFEVDFQTNSDSKIELILLKNGVVNKTLTLSTSGNTNFNRHTAKISVDDALEFDQLKISSTLEDKDNVKVYDIKTYKYTITGDTADFYVGSKRDREVYLTPNTYNLRILEEGNEKINENITVPTTGVLDYIYTPIERLECRLTLFNTEGSHLDFMDYHIKVNRSLNGAYNEFWLLDSIFSADSGTYANISIYDRFDTLIDTFKRLTSEYIDLEIEVYSLQIKNLMTQKTTLDINGTYIYPLLSGDSIYFMLSKSYYQIGYYDTNDVYKQFTIYLDSNQAYELNRSRICFLSYADQQGTHLSFDNYKTYINGSLIYENIFYREIGDIVGIEIKDRYDISIKNETYTVVSGDNYIPITLTMYSLKIMNQQEIFNWINITRDPNYYESSMYWSEWIAPTEIIEFKLFAGYYKINLTDNENSGSSYYSYTLNGDDVLLISSGNTISNLIINIANVNTTIGNQITNVQIDLTNQNSNINNTIINIDINLSNVNSSLGTLLTNINLDIVNINNNISNLYTFTENNFLNLGNNINNSFISIENNIIAINQTISTLVIGLDGKITIVNATINTMFTEMNSQFIVTQSTLDFSFTFLNQTIVQIGNNITENHIALNNLIIQRANEIDNSLIQISTLVNLINSSVVNESLVIQSLVNIIGNNITENHVIINDLINLIGNNITENNINMVSLIELVGNNITTNHFVIQTLIDYVSNNITENHLEFLTNINLINNTIGQNQIELINRLLFINNSINTMALDLTNQILLVNNTIYSAILDVYTSIEFNSDNILGNISLTYQQNDFLTELYKETMFSQLLNWSDVAFNYSLMESRIDVWEFINNYKNQSIEVHLRYQDIIDNLTITAQNSILQYLPKYDTDYNLWSVKDQKYLDTWEPLPDNRTVPFGFYEEVIPDIPDFNAPNTVLMIILILMGCGSAIALVGYMAYRYRKKSENYRRSYADKITLEAKTIKNFSQGTRIK